MRRLTVLGLLAATLALPAGAGARGDSGAPRLQAPVLADLLGGHRVRDRVLWSVPRSLQGAGHAGFWGGQTTTSTGEAVNIFFSDTYPVDTALQQKWVDFFTTLVHGAEISKLTVYVMPLAEVQASCRSAEADGCYVPIAQTLYIPGEDPPDGATTAEIATHEYGHHVAGNRINPPWIAVETGTKRWASYMNVCARTQDGTAFPGDEGAHYTLNPGEAFAETYRVMNEQRAGATLFSWPIVDESWFPDQTAVDLVAKDVTDPWTTYERHTLAGAFAKTGAKARSFAIVTPLDGQLSVSLRSPAGGKYQMTLLDKTGATVLRRGSKVNYTICGSEKLTIRVTRVGAAGRFTLQEQQP